MVARGLAALAGAAIVCVDAWRVWRYFTHWEEMDT
jgi:hypothetical protein